MIKSPLNYTGNKSRILEQLFQFFPKKINKFVDLCCGGASVGLNACADHVVCLDIDKKVISLLHALRYFSETTIIEKVEKLIDMFKLSYTCRDGYDKYRQYLDGNNGLKRYNVNGYLKLRRYYNENNFSNQLEKSICLFVLIIYCFNNDFRFNSNGYFNMPVGKTDFNDSIRNKLHSFKEGVKNKEIDFITHDFTIMKDFTLTRNDFVYVDPPYLITNAVYNGNGAKWDEFLEKNLLAVLISLHKRNIKFALSNVLNKGEKRNEILINWVHENEFFVKKINYHYRSSSYNKKDRETPEEEVLIVNYNV